MSDFPTLPVGHRHAVLIWFTGKGREQASTAMDLLERSLAQRYWLPQASRSVAAALRKSNLARRWARNEGKILDDYRHRERSRIYGALRFGQYELTASNPFPNALACATDEEREQLGVAQHWWNAMRPVAEVMRALDACRPPPVFTFLGLSPTVTATLESFRATKIEVCPSEVEWKVRTDARGREFRVPVLRLLWPAGTVHGSSPHCANASGMLQKCQACGHAIKNPSNWVPLVLWTGEPYPDERFPRSLWVGKDCAETLFGVKLSGTGAEWISE